MNKFCVENVCFEFEWDGHDVRVSHGKGFNLSRYILKNFKVTNGMFLVVIRGKYVKDRSFIYSILNYALFPTPHHIADALVKVLSPVYFHKGDFVPNSAKSLYFIPDVVRFLTRNGGRILNAMMNIQGRIEKNADSEGEGLLQAQANVFEKELVRFITSNKVGSHLFTQFDIDCKDVSILEMLKLRFPHGFAVETPHGFHFYVVPKVENVDNFNLPDCVTVPDTNAVVLPYTMYGGIIIRDISL